MARPIRFLLDGAVHELPADTDPTLTVLNLLRYHLRRTGTKEGCAEGDCGACTVVLGELEDGRVRFRAVNACILFAPMLDGRALFTVESLGREGSLHPVQQAMVDSHASQCGFCTPGFVMSLYALQREGAPADTPSLKDALAGNLCRCTGYGPILAAGQAMGRTPEPDIADALAAIRPAESLALEHGARRFYAPRSADELAAVLEANPDATVLAGGTDVGLWVTKQRRVLPTVVSLNECADLKRIEDLGDAVRIGAAARYADAHAALASLHPAFDGLLRRLGGLQVRNLGTVCGNIANGSPIGDMPPALIAAGATLVLRRGSARRELPLEAYFLDYGRQDRRPGEFVEAVTVPKPPPGRVVHIAKLSKRFDQDISAVCLGLSVGLQAGQVTDARIAFGGMAATPKRAPRAEAALAGRAWTAATVETAAEVLADDFTPITDMRASAGYRLEAARNLLRRAFVEAAGGDRLQDLEAVSA
ncbi:MAG: xanthine dehydrogenase small subunit [Phenylobacterium sp.]|uniref:xanthine dehydrogenase small subunit n=1 Tax=Phenylobacterium sp. TaxID=1871053 RepID=UPI001A51BFBE|nr:xanthine dehydrogenase small subunit [Phenylobacterium sp.]MBL8770700.1 xanthine dehydrogenase small subunit [Phenylobacterium sp.]